MNLTDVYLDDFQAAYLEEKGSYLDTGYLWKRLSDWAARNNLFPPEINYFGISFDEPDIPDDQKTLNACIKLPVGYKKTDKEVLFKTIKGGRFLLYKFYDTNDRLALVYKDVVSEWLPSSKYELDDRDFLEFVMNDPFSDPENKCKIDLYIPVKDKTIGL